MARRQSGARRYAEAAFEVGLRDDAVETWRRELDAASERGRGELDAASEIVADERVARLLGNPAIAEETRLDLAESTFGKIASRPVLNLIGLMLRRGRIDELPRVAAEFRRLDNERQGITIATATS